MKYKVGLSRNAQKGIRSLPLEDKKILVHLVRDISNFGPMQPKYSNFSKIGKNKYHCHLSYRWVACWKLINGKCEVEVYYVGTRESAPY